jgi:hypothetical protein
MQLFGFILPDKLIKSYSFIRNPGSKKGITAETHGSNSIENYRGKTRMEEDQKFKRPGKKKETGTGAQAFIPTYDGVVQQMSISDDS